MAGRIGQRKIAKIISVLASVTVFLLYDAGTENPRRQTSEVDSNDLTTTRSSKEGVEHQIFDNILEDDIGAWNDSKYLSQPEEVIPMEDRRPDDEIRYASFGSSCTWGSRLEDREKEAYVWRLSDLDKERGRNYAIRANGPAYPALCLSTMLGEEEFDVIILEFLMRSDQGLLDLAQRLRQRFPNAIIVMTSLWHPFAIVNKKKGGTIYNWASQHGHTSSTFVHDPKFHELFLAEGETEDDEWFHEVRSPGVQAWKETATEVGAYTYRLPGDTSHGGGEHGWLKMGDAFLADDSFHLSAGGHEDIAKKVKAIVDRVGVPKQRTVNKFADDDRCSNWFLSGEIGEGITYAPNVSFGKMPNTEKYALNFEMGNEKDGNWMEFENTSDKEMELSITYMTTGPAPSMYPEVEATSESGAKYLLDSKCMLDVGGKPIHISKLQNLGTVGAHSTVRITFKPLNSSEWPFRVAAAMLTGISQSSVLVPKATMFVEEGHYSSH
jgi:hypothetical protein